MEGCTDRGVGAAEAAGAIGALGILGAAKAMGAKGAAGDIGCFTERLEMDEECAEECVDTDGVREKAWRLRDAADSSESRDMRDMDRDLATASTEFFLV